MSFSLQTKNTTTYTNQTEHLVDQFLLKEDSGYLLLESGSKIILEQSIPADITYTLQTKNAT